MQGGRQSKQRTRIPGMVAVHGVRDQPPGEWGGRMIQEYEITDTQSIKQEYDRSARTALSGLALKRVNRYSGKESMRALDLNTATGISNRCVYSDGLLRHHL